MRKTILALAIPAATIMMASAHAANVYNADGTSLDVYGRVEVDATNAGGNDSATGTDTQGSMDSSARLGIKGSTKVNEDVSIFGKAEWQVAGETSDEEEFHTRYMYLGADFGDEGKVSFGQQYTPLYTSLVSTVDIFEQWGMEAQAGIYGESRQSGMAIYSNKFGNWDVQAGYQFHNEDGLDNEGVSTDVQDNAYSATAVYDTGVGVNLRVAYARQNFEDDSKIDVYGAGADYANGNLYLAAVYLGSRADDDSTNTDTDIDSFDYVAAYTMGQYRAYTGWGVQREDDESSDETTINSYKLGVEYNITSNALTWVEYRHNDGDEDADNYYGANEIAVSAQYNF